MSNGITTPPAATSDPTVPQYGVDLVPQIDFAVKDPAIIINEVILDYQAAFLALTNIAKTLAPGDPVRLFLLVVCHWLSHQRTLIDFTGKMNLLKYAHDDYLDNLAALHGDRALRLPASPAQCTLQFTLTAALAFDVTIPAGTQCQAPNSILFQTTADGFIKAGDTQVDVRAQCMTAGLLGNGFTAGQISYIVNWNQPFALTVANIDTTNGGADKETDDQYRYRVWLAIESYSTCGPHDAYEFWALSADPSIIQAMIYSAPEIAGEVWIYPLCRVGGVITLPSQEILDLVYASCNDKKRRPLTDFVSVFAPVTVPYVLDFDYYVLTEEQVLLSTIQANVQQAVNDYVDWQQSYISRDLNCDELIKRVIEAGAKRVVINSPSPSFQAMAYNQLAVLDTTVTPNPRINFAGLEDE
jgi:phage-related baseplate assembly protein